MKRTLKELLLRFSPEFIILRFDEHLVNIDLNVKGSKVLYKTFELYKFEYSFCEETKMLICTY